MTLGELNDRLGRLMVENPHLDLDDIPRPEPVPVVRWAPGERFSPIIGYVVYDPEHEPYQPYIGLFHGFGDEGRSDWFCRWTS